MRAEIVVYVHAAVFAKNGKVGSVFESQLQMRANSELYQVNLRQSHKSALADLRNKSLNHFLSNSNITLG